MTNLSIGFQLTEARKKIEALEKENADFRSRLGLDTGNFILVRHYLKKGHKPQCDAMDPSTNLVELKDHYLNTRLGYELVEIWDISLKTKACVLLHSITPIHSEGTWP